MKKEMFTFYNPVWKRWGRSRREVKASERVCKNQAKRKYQSHILHTYIVWCDWNRATIISFFPFFHVYYYVSRRLFEYHLFVMQQFLSFSLSRVRFFSLRCSLLFAIHLQPNAISHLKIFRSNIHSDTFDCRCIVCNATLENRSHTRTNLLVPL